MLMCKRKWSGFSFNVHGVEEGDYACLGGLIHDPFDR